MRHKQILIGVCIVLLLTTMVYSADLSDFPKMFIKDNALDVIIIVGKHADAEDVIGAIDIAGMLHYELGILTKKSIARLDIEVDNITSQNILVVGGPCANSAAGRLLGFPANCMEGFKVGEGKIRLFEHDNGKVSVLVAGATVTDTRIAANILADYKNPEYNLEGKEMTIRTVEFTELGVKTKS